MKHYEPKHIAVLSDRGFYTILTVCGLVIAASAWVLWMHGGAGQEAALSEPAAQAVTPAEDVPDLTAQDMPVTAEVPEPETETEAPEPEENVQTAAPAPEPEPAVTVSAPVYTRPTDGAVLTPFSGDMLLFQPTLGDWRVHSGTDFACGAGENVLALTDGTVQAVFEDGLYGTCVTVAHQGDLKTTVRGLSEVRVSEGQAVSSGEVLGVCAASIPAEETLGTHVHVEAVRGDTVVDVMELLGEEE